MRSNTRAARSKTKFFWGWVNYVWLHLHSSQRRVKRLLSLCGYWVPKTYFFSVTRWLSLYRSLPSMLQLYPASNSYFMTSQLLFWNVFWKFFERILFTLSHFQSYVVAFIFIEQDQNTEKSKASIVEVVSCFATVKARIQERQSDVHIKPS